MYNVDHQWYTRYLIGYLLINYYFSVKKVVVFYLLIQGGPQKMQKLNEYPTTKSLNHEFIRACQN